MCLKFKYEPHPCRGQGGIAWHIDSTGNIPTKEHAISQHHFEIVSLGPDLYQNSQHHATANRDLDLVLILPTGSTGGAAAGS